MAIKQNKSVNADQRKIGVTAELIEKSKAYIGAQQRQNEMVTREITQQQDLMAQYRALILLYDQLKTKGQDVRGTFAALNRVVDERNKLVQEGKVTTERFMAAESKQNSDITKYPDGLILGKALSGGLLPLSAFVTNSKVMDMAFHPGTEGSTFGGYPLATVAGNAALDVLTGEDLTVRS